jgi:FkbM family methyltransferase
MNMIARLKLGLFGLALRIVPKEAKRRLGVRLGVPDIRWSLRKLRELGFYPGPVMDVGAFQGDWARICLDIFPESVITCIEPQHSVQEQLRSLAARNPNIRVVQTLLGREPKAHVPFVEDGPGSSLFHNRAGAKSSPMMTIDALIDKGISLPPEFLKLDVQGYELEILKGFIRHFEACQVIQCELSLLPLHPEMPLLHEAISYLHQRGFFLFDLEEIIRGRDGVVWQLDALFCRMDSPLRRKRVWGQ